MDSLTVCKQSDINDSILITVHAMCNIRFQHRNILPNCLFVLIIMPIYYVLHISPSWSKCILYPRHDCYDMIEHEQICPVFRGNRTLFCAGCLPNVFINGDNVPKRIYSIIPFHLSTQRPFLLHSPPTTNAPTICDVHVMCLLVLPCCGASSDHGLLR